MTKKEEEEYAEAQADFKRIDEIQNRIISLSESIGVIRSLKDKSDAMFAGTEARLQLDIKSLEKANRELRDGK